jgi:hypothetical protein
MGQKIDPGSCHIKSRSGEHLAAISMWIIIRHVENIQNREFGYYEYLVICLSVYISVFYSCIICLLISPEKRQGKRLLWRPSYN